MTSTSDELLANVEEVHIFKAWSKGEMVETKLGLL